MFANYPKRLPPQPRLRSENEGGKRREKKKSPLAALIPRCAAPAAEASTTVDMARAAVATSARNDNEDRRCG